ncbi:hypothetical protein FJY68_00550 [candidate division WOR-3 bacterium]|uniref:Uncharacterized protein n=1 Tax=candidate division WOR-3 bacterium TaxID=2052148 RepID=A0A937XER4_UNCW3|nr:hypothetical protein [candidate division WOR-3 bacterium]
MAAALALFVWSARRESQSQTWSIVIGIGIIVSAVRAARAATQLVQNQQVMLNPDDVVVTRWGRRFASRRYDEIERAHWGYVHDDDTSSFLGRLVPGPTEGITLKVGTGLRSTRLRQTECPMSEIVSRARAHEPRNVPCAVLLRKNQHELLLFPDSVVYLKLFIVGDFCILRSRDTPTKADDARLRIDVGGNVHVTRLGRVAVVVDGMHSLQASQETPARERIRVASVDYPLLSLHLPLSFLETLDLRKPT